MKRRPSGKGRKAAAVSARVRSMYSFEVQVVSSHMVTAKFIVIAATAMAACSKALDEFLKDGYLGVPRVHSLLCHGVVRA